MAQEEEEGGGEGAAGGGKGLAPGYTADDRAEFVFFCSEIMDCSLDFRVLIAAVSQVPLGAGRGAEDGADWVLLAPGAASTLSHVQLGEQEESSLHMRWGIWPSQMLLAAVQPPQWAVVLQVYLLHLCGGGEVGGQSDVAIWQWADAVACSEVRPLCVSGSTGGAGGHLLKSQECARQQHAVESSTQSRKQGAVLVGDRHGCGEGGCSDRLVQGTGSEPRRQGQSAEQDRARASGVLLATAFRPQRDGGRCVGGRTSSRTCQ